MDTVVSHAAMPARARGRAIMRTLGRAMARTARAMAEPGEMDTVLARQSRAQFSLLSRSEQNRLLNRGHRH